MRGIIIPLFLTVMMVPVVSVALPRQIDPPGERMVLVDPNTHQWGAYDADGELIRAGIASAGRDWCEDMGRQCHTDVGYFRIKNLGSANCTSPSFPIPDGGSPMPYCMYFNEVQALHGYPHIDRKNRSHGCVRMKTSDAKWLRYNFARVGTLVVVLPYN